ncbi:unnamed protein product [Rhizophagus irregularis]|uniref:Uncharacterized protein n=1 Tax=Rhizophagus irregularis TaxID=588596 RepID=A0A916EAT9_9GLOM|nr:unnamed protein product [Rhizophagus irregularis]
MKAFLRFSSWVCSRMYMSKDTVDVMDEVGTSDEAIPHNLLSSLPFWAASAVYISQLERLTGQRIQDLSFSLFH